MSDEKPDKEPATNTKEQLFPPTRPEDVFGCLKYKGKPKTIKDMNAGIKAEVMARHARARY